MIEIFESPVAHCPLCGAHAVAKLPPGLLAQQTDGTTHVCHPSHGGCNHGFEDMGHGPEAVAKPRIVSSPAHLELGDPVIVHAMGSWYGGYLLRFARNGKVEVAYTSGTGARRKKLTPLASVLPDATAAWSAIGRGRMDMNDARQLAADFWTSARPCVLRSV